MDMTGRWADKREKIEIIGGRGPPIVESMQFRFYGPPCIDYITRSLI